jgi:hypothetical protein
MRRKELRELIRTAEIYKMSLGKNAAYRQEALRVDALVFQSEIGLYDAVVAGDRARIAAAAVVVKAEKYPKANAPENAWSVWCKSIETFRALPARTLVLHWEADQDHLHWGIVSDRPFVKARQEPSEYGQAGYVFHRPLVDGWRRTSVNGVPISNLHPKARHFAINMATLNRVQTHQDYFRAVLLDEDTSQWSELPEWRAKARQSHWHPKPVAELRTERRRVLVTRQVQEIADHFEAEIRRMADTAIKTAAYANGQTVLRTVKNKDIDFTREELEEEIADLLREQGDRCKLTGYDFKRVSGNPHLKPSLDRIDSRLGYVEHNLQVVTRAANFYKSASDAEDWKAKANALEHMAVAIQQRRKGDYS